MSCKLSLCLERKNLPFLSFFLLLGSSVIFTVSLQHLDSGLWSGTEQARLWLGKLGDLWQRLIALCCV